MSDCIRIQRRKQIVDSYSYPQLATNTSGLRMGTATTSVNHDISSISLRPQTRLTVSQPGDFYEQEADRVAQQVMTMGDQANNNAIQREASPHEEEENLQLKYDGNTITPLVQREEIAEEEEEEEEELVQAKSSLQMFDYGGLAASSDISSKLDSRKGQGNPLADDVRNFMEPRFGVDFSNVKVHTDGEAVQMSHKLGAQAFTYGNDVYFGAGKSPGNNDLTAHELTHVVQQVGGVQRKLTIGYLGFEQVMRDTGDTTDSQTEEVSVSLASDQEADSIGHSWVIIQMPDQSKDSYGFWPKNFSILGSLALGWYDGLVMHPDNVHQPDAIFTKKTTMKLLQQGIDYANSQLNSSYHLLFFNCSTFARTMFEKATGQTAPSGGLLIDSPNELADKIREKNMEEGLDSMGNPLPKYTAPPAPGWFLPSPPVPTMQ